MALEASSEDIFEMAEQAARYRVVLVEAIHALADREKQLHARDRIIAQQRDEIRTLRAGHEQQIGRARDEYRKVRDENRQLRATIMQADMGRAA